MRARLQPPAADSAAIARHRRPEPEIHKWRAPARRHVLVRAFTPRNKREWKQTTGEPVRLDQRTGGGGPRSDSGERGGPWIGDSMRSTTAPPSSGCHD